jgi:hypothetical protein
LASILLNDEKVATPNLILRSEGREARKSAVADLRTKKADLG